MNATSETKPGLRSLWAIPLVGAVVVAFSIVWVFVISDEDRFPPANPVSISMANKPPTLIEVLTFEGIEEDRESSTVAQAVHAGVVVHLSQLDDLRIAGSESTDSDKAEAQDHSDEPAQFILAGTVHEADGSVRVSIRISDPASRKEVWRKDFERTASEMFDLRTTIAREVATEIRARTSVTDLMTGQVGAP